MPDNIGDLVPLSKDYIPAYEFEYVPTGDYGDLISFSDKDWSLVPIDYENGLTVPVVMQNYIELLPIRLPKEVIITGLNGGVTASDQAWPADFIDYIENNIQIQDLEETLNLYTVATSQAYSTVYHPDEFISNFFQFFASPTPETVEVPLHPEQTPEEFVKNFYSSGKLMYGDVLFISFPYKVRNVFKPYVKVLFDEMDPSVFETTTINEWVNNRKSVLAAGASDCSRFGMVIFNCTPFDLDNGDVFVPGYQAQYDDNTSVVNGVGYTVVDPGVMDGSNQNNVFSQIVSAIVDFYGD